MLDDFFEKLTLNDEALTRLRALGYQSTVTEATKIDCICSDKQYLNLTEHQLALIWSGTHTRKLARFQILAFECKKILLYAFRRLSTEDHLDAVIALNELNLIGESIAESEAMLEFLIYLGSAPIDATCYSYLAVRGLHLHRSSVARSKCEIGVTEYDKSGAIVLTDSLVDVLATSPFMRKWSTKLVAEGHNQRFVSDNGEWNTYLSIEDQDLSAAINFYEEDPNPASMLKIIILLKSFLHQDSVIDYDLDPISLDDILTHLFHSYLIVLAENPLDITPLCTQFASMWRQFADLYITAGAWSIASMADLLSDKSVTFRLSNE